MAVPADHAGVHVMPGESPFVADGFGMGGGELVMREDQVAAAALDVEAGADAAERNRRAFDVPAGPAGAEGRRASSARRVARRANSSASSDCFACPASGSPPRSESKELRDVVEGQLGRAEVVVIAGGVGGAAAESVRAVLSELGEMEVARIAMHPGSVQGFGQLGREGVPVFLLPANPVSALVVFEVMVRPLIRMSLGKRQPLRRVVQARTLSPISSVAGRKGYLRGQLMRDQDTGEYLVQALGGAPGASSHLLATLAEANCLVTVPSEAEQVRTGEIVDVAFLAQRG